MTTHAETEFKLRADRPLEVAVVDGVLRETDAELRNAGSRRHVDEYLDDAEGSLAHAGVGLRIRRAADGAMLCCKRGAPGADGLFVREECEAEWPSDGPPATAAELPAPLRARVEPFTLDRPLGIRLRLATQRETRTLTRDGRVFGVVCVDATTATAGDRSERFDEIEVELTAPDDLDACRPVAARLAERLRLTFATEDKPTFAAARLGLDVAPPAAAEPASGLAAAVAHRVAQDVQALAAAEAETRAERTPESLHALRVVLRRLRSLVRAFRDLWREADAELALAALGEASRRCGELRDLDVGAATMREQAERLPEALADGAAAALAWAEAERSSAAERLHAWFAEPARLAGERACRAALLAMDPNAAAAALPAADELTRRIAVAAARLRKRIDGIDGGLPTPAVHELRIAGKRLRYLAESFADDLVDVPGKALRRLVHLQQAIGVVCDHENAVARLAGWLRPAAASAADGAQVAAALGALLARHDGAAGRARKAARRAIARVDRKRTWRAFGLDDAADANLAG